ncbi:MULTISPECIES: membrane protein [Streptomyces]|uniref:Membrane protein n=1 Tax=Streptomyces viridochromogenes TaxID=1938 RepID=A0A0L8J7G3_STRVR|nr:MULTISPECIES: membrane protein [Streptomyces]KOG09627.1 membrane protein [Streptomyces viridochromogenes]
MSLVDELKSAVTPRAALLVVGVFALQLLFITSYVGALHNPKPTDVPFGVVAPGQAATVLEDRLEELPGDPLDPRVVADEAEARDQILNRDIDGALIVDPRGRTDTLLVASGGGKVLSATLEAMITKLEAANQRLVRTVDVAPSSSQDFNGLSAFYLVIGWCVGGYICAAILAISAGSRPANRERAIIRLGVLALYAALGGLGGAIIVGPILGALPGSIAALWGLGTLVVFAVGAATLALQSVFGIVGIGLAILLIVIAGNPSAGGAFPLPMLPPFWRAIGPYLPPGAGTWAARSIAYFKGNGMTASMVILSVWAIVGAAVTLVLSSVKRKPKAEPIASEMGGTPA